MKLLRRYFNQIQIKNVNSVIFIYVIYKTSRAVHKLFFQSALYMCCTVYFEKRTHVIVLNQNLKNWRLINPFIQVAIHVKVYYLSLKGYIWSKMKNTHEHWEAEVVFRVNGRGRIGADGLVSDTSLMFKSQILCTFLLNLCVNNSFQVPVIYVCSCNQQHLE